MSNSSVWLGSKELSQLANIHPVKASALLKECFTNKKVWRGVQLTIQIVSGEGRGGKNYQVLLTSLPVELQAKYYKSIKPELKANLREFEQATKDVPNSETLWSFYASCTTTKKEEAQRRLEILVKIEQLMATGLSRNQAIEQAGEERRTIYRWMGCIKDLGRNDWLPALIPHQVGGKNFKEYDPEIYQVFKDFYLTRQQLTLQMSYKLTEDYAQANNLGDMPTLDVLRRRLKIEVSQQTQDLLREGEQAKSFQNSVPPLQRDKSMLCALARYQAMLGNACPPSSCLAKLARFVWRLLYVKRSTVKLLSTCSLLS